MLNLSMLFPVIGILIFIGIVLFFVWIWAIIDCLKSQSSAEYKLMWLLIIVFLNIIGAVLYFIFGDYKQKVYFKKKGKYLTRSSDNKMIGGVCGGLAEHFNFDPAIIRILWVVFTIFVNGVGILLYIIAWIAIPSDKDIKQEKNRKDNGEGKAEKNKSGKTNKSKNQSDYASKDFKRKRRSFLGIVFAVLVLTLLVSFVLFFVFLGNMKYDDVKQISVKNLVVDVRSDVSEKIVIDEIMNSYNYKNFDGYDLRLLEINNPEDDSCILLERDPYGLKIYDSGCREFIHAFLVVSDSFEGYEVNTLTSGGRVLKMVFTEIKNTDKNVSFENKVFCLPEQRSADFCIEVFDPVCGVSAAGKMMDFSNSCFACSNPEIEFFVNGECW